MTPTQNSLAKLRAAGYPLVQVVEKVVPKTFIRQDLFGIIDILAVRENETLAVQTTSMNSKSEHLKKLLSSESLPILRAAGWVIHLHCWKGKGVRAVCQVTDLTYDL